MASLFRSTERPESDPREPAEGVPEGLTLAHVIALKVPVSWQEAVAVVLETARDLPSTATFPEPADVTLTAIGEVHRRSVRGASGSPVVHAAELLSDLLRDGSAPPELRTLIEQNVTDPPTHASLGAFVTALNYFERPNRRADVAAVYTRGFTLLQSSSSQQELERIRAKIGRDRKAKSPELGLLARIAGPLSQFGLAIALCIIIAVSGYTLISMALGPVSVAQDDGGTAVALPQPTVAETMTAAGERLKDLVTTGLSLVTTRAETVAPSPAPAKPRRPISTAAADEWIVSVRDVTATYVAAEGDTAAAADSSALDVPSPESKIDSSSGAIREPAAPIVGPVFSAGDVNVDPATLVKPKLPSRARDIANPDDLAILEVVVNEEGTVDSAKLTGLSQRLNDKMLVAAAKAWIFDPARLNGQPVRYLLRIQITE
jgi:hypothetical protein